MSSDTESNRPEWASEYPTYEELVKSWGYDVLGFEEFGSYQGDHLALLSDGDSVGLIVFGYGSCSGCDELQARTPWSNDEDWSPVAALADEMRQNIHWEANRDSLRDWVDARPENHWWCYDDEIAAWLNENLGTHLGATS